MPIQPIIQNRQIFLRRVDAHDVFILFNWFGLRILRGTHYDSLENINKSFYILLGK
ncbi:MAG: hypothetical protein JNL70_20995 [Saprospiraceae bacterium]|nr:hypothetical protein [Saprospiraceae bacterium]